MEKCVARLGSSVPQLTIYKMAAFHQTVEKGILQRRRRSLSRLRASTKTAPAR